MKTFFKTISKYKISSILNILGLAAAFSALYIILVQVHYDLTFNKNIKDSERICVVFAPGWTGIDSYQANMSRTMANRLFTDCPLIEYYAVGDVVWQSVGCVARDGEVKEARRSAALQARGWGFWA